MSFYVLYRILKRFVCYNFVLWSAQLELEPPDVRKTHSLRLVGSCFVMLSGFVCCFPPALSYHMYVCIYIKTFSHASLSPTTNTQGGTKVTSDTIGSGGPTFDDFQIISVGLEEGNSLVCGNVELPYLVI